MFPQNFSGRVTYQAKVVLKIKNPKPEHDTPEFKERLEAINKSMGKRIFWNLLNTNPSIRKKKITNKV